MTLSVIIPVCGSSSQLALCLSALAASTRQPDDVVVVDDGSGDEAGAVSDLAKEHDARLVVLPMSRGPAAARNAGAALATGEVLMFLDADAVVHSNTLRQVEEFLSGHEEFACVFGSYDAQPAVPGWVSWYRNLLHHYVHQRAAGEVASFWAGCGAVRRAAFEAVGGFNEGFRRPSVEDIELGWRLRAARYRIWLHPEIQVQHLKAWTFASMLTVDIRDRAVPWSRLIAQKSAVSNQLNLTTRNRVSGFAAVSIAALLPLAAFSSFALYSVAALVATVGALNIGLYRFFANRRGLGFAFAAAGLHFLYLVSSAVTFIFVTGRVRFRRVLRVDAGREVPSGSPTSQPSPKAVDAALSEAPSYRESPRTGS